MPNNLLRAPVLARSLRWAALSLLVALASCASEPIDEGGDDDDDVGAPMTCGNDVCDEAPSSCPADCEPEPPPEDPATLVVLNDSSHTIYAFYLAKCTADTWGINRLGNDVMPPGYQLTLPGNEAGCYDFRADGTENSSWDTSQGQPIYLYAGQVETWTLVDAAGAQ